VEPKAPRPEADNGNQASGDPLDLLLSAVARAPDLAPAGPEFTGTPRFTIRRRLGELRHLKSAMPSQTSSLNWENTSHASGSLPTTAARNPRISGP
jgi:hypothetical protein